MDCRAMKVVYEASCAAEGEVGEDSKVEVTTAFTTTLPPPHRRTMSAPPSVATHREIATDEEARADDIEARRILKLKSLQLLDTDAEDQFDRIVGLAAKTFHAPIALISLVDSTRQWFKARVGLAAACTSRDVSFCTHAITSEELFEVQDALEDPRFKENPLVTGDPWIRYYAGAPLVTADGFRLGTLCIIDRGPRKSMPAADREVLKDMARLVISLFEQRKKMLDLEAAKQQVEATEKLKVSILAQTAHEIRTPLTSLLGLVDLLLDANSNGSDTLSSQQLRYVQLMKDAGSSLHQLLSDILDFSKMEARKLIVESIEFQPFKLAEEVVEFFRPRCLNCPLRFQYFPISPSKILTVLGDPTRLRQILWNLLSNAVKFTSSGEILVKAREMTLSDCIEECRMLGRSSPKIPRSRDLLDASEGEAPAKEARGEYVSILFEVSDTGIGMTEEQLRKICRPFAQAEDASTSRRFGGTGLGLVICNKLVNLMGGRLVVQSSYGSGSTFSFILNFKVPVLLSDVTGSVSSATSSPKDSPLVPKLRVLVADDNSTIRMLMERFIRKLGHDIVLVENGEEALKRLSETGSSFDVFFCDSHMPVMDGLDTISTIRKEFPDSVRSMPIVMFTADVLEESLATFQSLGVSDVLSKPIDLKRLNSILVKLFGTNPE